MRFFQSSKVPVRALPFRLYFYIVLGLSACGLMASVYLSVSHYRVYTDMGYRSFCAISRAINCDTVSQSPYAIFLNVPVPVWGIGGYFFFMLFLFLAEKGKLKQARLWTIAFLIALLFSLYSLVLAFISSYYIGAYCLVCIFTYAVNFLLAYFTWLITTRFSRKHFVGRIREDVEYLKSRKKKVAVLTGTFVLIAAAVILFFPAYWNIGTAESAVRLPTGITADGHPWIGAQSPKLEIIEFTDYQCFQCKKMYFFLRRLIAEHPDKIRLVHRHFPMDHKLNPIVKAPFHVGSGAMALMAIAAMSQQRFWQMNDVLYAADLKKGMINIRKVAKRAEVDYDALTREMMDIHNLNKLIGDIRRGQKLGVNGTPAYLINGKLYLGQIPAHVLETALR
jgi:protein-disulfide isomerase/uncharacterized membrane protein